jgi:hypothetical protein
MAISHSPRIVRDGLVLALDAADRNSYPGSGTTWYDLSGNGNNGTLTNGTSYSTSNSGIFVFDGSDDYVNFGDLDILSGAFSVNAWFKGDTTQTGNYATIVSKDIGGSFGEFAMTSDSNNTYIRFGFNGSDGQHAVSNSLYSDIKANSWVNYCGTWDGSSNLKLYRNSTLIDSDATATGTLVSNNSNLMIGDRTAADGYFGGDIAIVQIYTKELTATEVLQNYNATKTRFGL